MKTLNDTQKDIIAFILILIYIIIIQFLFNLLLINN